ncbi:MAG: hypothetical protein II730_02180 [Bacteroidales bacterium]|nr:hypothetical protein [Bacteroidales bacterium]
MTHKISVTRQGEVRPSDATRAATRLYLRHAADLVRSFDSWKENPRYYFIELGLNMAYFVAGVTAHIAEPPYHLGTIIRCSLEHPELFSFSCPECGKPVYSHSYNGSPLSGRFDLSGVCPECGWRGYVTKSGWWVRSDALKAVQKEDRKRLLRAKLLKLTFRPATIENLLRKIGVPEEEIILEPEKVTEKRYELSEERSIVFRSDGSYEIIDKEPEDSSPLPRP